MKIIADACTIILLAKASVLETAAAAYQIAVTAAVYEEVVGGKQHMFADALLLERLNKEKAISTSVSEEKLTQKLMKDFNMGNGEASTIAAAISEKEGIVATDNRQGRKAASVNNLQLVGSIDIVVALFRKKRIDMQKAIAALKKLKEEGWFEPHLLEKAMEDLK